MQVWSLGQEDPLEEVMATHSSILALRIPMDRGAWWATVCGVIQSWTSQKWLSLHVHTGTADCDRWYHSEFYDYTYSVIPLSPGRGHEFGVIPVSQMRARELREMRWCAQGCRVRICGFVSQMWLPEPELSLSCVRPVARGPWRAGLGGQEGLHSSPVAPSLVLGWRTVLVLW